VSAHAGSAARVAAPEGFTAGEILGRGATSVTFVVERTDAPSPASDDASAVCKRLLPRTVRDATARASLVREGAALRRLEGRGGPRWIAEGDDAHGPWLILERLAMRSLGARLRAGAGPLEPAMVARACDAAFAALALVH
jgi:hypothetical protein